MADDSGSYALNRMLDTGVGVAMSLLLNWALPRERLERWLAPFYRRSRGE